MGTQYYMFYIFLFSYQFEVAVDRVAQSMICVTKCKPKLILCVI